MHHLPEHLIDMSSSYASIKLRTGFTMFVLALAYNNFDVLQTSKSLLFNDIDT
jgi:hypothetical protein